MVAVSLYNDLYAATGYPAKEAAHPGLTSWVQMSLRVLNYKEGSRFCQETCNDDGQGV